MATVDICCADLTRAAQVVGHVIAKFIKKGKGRHKEISFISYVVQHGWWEWGITNICLVEN